MPFDMLPQSSASPAPLPTQADLHALYCLLISAVQALSVASGQPLPPGDIAARVRETCLTC